MTMHDNCIRQAPHSDRIPTTYAGGTSAVLAALLACFGCSGSNSQGATTLQDLSGSWSGTCAIGGSTSSLDISLNADASGTIAGQLTDKTIGQTGPISGAVTGSSVTATYTYPGSSGGTLTGTVLSSGNNVMTVTGTITTGGASYSTTCTLTRRVASGAADAGANQTGASASADAFCTKSGMCSGAALSASESQMCTQMIGAMFQIVPDEGYTSACFQSLSCSQLQDTAAVQNCLDLDNSTVVCAGSTLHGCTKTSRKCTDIDCYAACGWLGTDYDHCGFDSSKNHDVCYCSDTGVSTPLPPTGPSGGNTVFDSGVGSAVPDASGGITTFDASLPVPDVWTAPSSPEASAPPVCARVGLIRTTNAFDIALRGQTLYIADGDGGMKTADVSNPFAPRVTGTLAPVQGSIVAVALGETYVYAYDHVAGLLVIDATNPASPVIVGRLSLQDSSSYIPSTPASSSEGGLAVVGNRAYVGGTFATGICAVDISTPTAPALIGDCSSGIGWATSFVVKDSFLYATSPFEFLVVNIANPSGPLSVGTYEPEGSASGSFGMFGHYALVAGTPTSLVIDLSLPTAPQPVGSISVYGSAAATTGPYGLIAASSELDFIALDDPTHPKVLGSCKGSGSSYSAHRIVADSQRAYLAHGNEGVSVWQLAPDRLPGAESKDAQ